MKTILISLFLFAAVSRAEFSLESAQFLTQKVIRNCVDCEVRSSQDYERFTGDEKRFVLNGEVTIKLIDNESYAKRIIRFPMHIKFEGKGVTASYLQSNKTFNITGIEGRPLKQMFGDYLGQEYSFGIGAGVSYFSLKNSKGIILKSQKIGRGQVGFSAINYGSIVVEPGVFEPGKKVEIYGTVELVTSAEKKTQRQDLQSILDTMIP